MVALDFTDITQQRTDISKYQSMNQLMNELLKISVLKQSHIITIFADHISLMEFFLVVRLQVLINTRRKTYLWSIRVGVFVYF